MRHGRNKKCITNLQKNNLHSAIILITQKFHLKSPGFWGNKVLCMILDFLHNTKTLRDQVIHAFAQELSPFLNSIGITPPENLATLITDGIAVYEKSPIRQSYGGNRLVNGLSLYVVLRCLNPDVVLESGVYKGFTSYIFTEATAAHTKLYCFDPRPDYRLYSSPKASYHTDDITGFQASVVNGSKIAFFDDHQAQLDRIEWALANGITTMILDDDHPLSSMFRSGQPPVPSLAMIQEHQSYTPGKSYQWQNRFGVFTYTHTEALAQRMQKIIARLETAISFPTFYAQTGLIPTSPMTFARFKE
jgi:hypothetical protein